MYELESWGIKEHVVRTILTTEMYALRRIDSALPLEKIRN